MDAAVIHEDPETLTDEVILAMKENLFECPDFLRSLCAFLEVLKMELEKEIEEWGAQVLQMATKDNIDCLYKLPTMILEEDGYVHMG